MQSSAQTHSEIGPGTLIGPWRVLARWDRGSFGVVFRVERDGHPEAGSFALKLAMKPEDPRFPREVELLQRVVHPSVPRFEDQGWWTGLEGRAYPYVVMEWVEGTPLYVWGRERRRTSAEVLRLFAQLAGALAVAHAADGLHRDVKGDNVLVTPEGRAVLLDWGGGTHEGAKEVTDTVLPPGTRQYRTPEALRWAWEHWEPYKAGPPDDVYALAVMAYRLCTGTYPPLPEEGSGPQPRRLPPSDLATVSAGLERFLLAALTEERLSRPRAEALTIDFSVAAQDKDAAQPIVPTRSAASTEIEKHPGPPREFVVPRWLSAIGGAGVGALLVLALLKPRHDPEPVLASGRVEQQRYAPSPEAPDAGVADEALSAVQDAPTSGMPTSALGVRMPKQPLPGQRKPPCERGQRAINGGCWAGPIKGESSPCGQQMFDYENECYFLVLNAPRQPTSEEPAMNPP